MSPTLPPGYNPALGYCFDHEQSKPCPQCELLDAAGGDGIALAHPQGGTAVLKMLDDNSGLALWSGEFGDAYTDRNQVDWRDRVQFWSEVLEKTGARSAFEVGCNAGWNLSAIENCAINTLYGSHRVTVGGNDINTRACEQAWSAGLKNVANLFDFTGCYPMRAELVFTAGVLIHIEDEHLEEVMRALIAKSYRWVLAVEYGEEQQRPITYRGFSDKCWARPYGRLYQDLGLRLVDSGDPGAGFDKCTYWMLEK